MQDAKYQTVIYSPHRSREPAFLQSPSSSSSNFLSRQFSLLNEREYSLLGWAPSSKLRAEKLLSYRLLNTE